MKADRDIEHSGVMEHTRWKTGGGTEMLVEEGKVLRKPEEITECLSRIYEKKLKKVEAKIENPRKTN